MRSSSYHDAPLDRTPLYTSHTRAKKMVAVMAAWHAVTKAVETNHLK